MKPDRQLRNVMGKAVSKVPETEQARHDSQSAEPATTVQRSCSTIGVFQQRAIRLATVWLGGCSGCHMSLLNLHGGLLELFEKCELVYSPLADIKEYPEGVDLVLVEGAVGNGENYEMARRVRERSRLVASLGDCATDGNVTSLRNPRGSRATLDLVYPQQAGTWDAQVPPLLPTVLPLHQVIPVDAFIPGCPPRPEEIAAALAGLLALLGSV